MSKTNSSPGKFCAGKNSKGKPCKLRAISESAYCRFHYPDNSQMKEQKKIISFFTKHKEGIAGFLTGSISDPIIGDIYEYLKEKTGMRHLIPPIQEKTPESIGQRYQHDKNYLDLCNICYYLKPGMPYKKILEWLGDPDHYITDVAHHKLLFYFGKTEFFSMLEVLTEGDEISYYYLIVAEVKYLSRSQSDLYHVALNFTNAVKLSD